MNVDFAWIIVFQIVFGWFMNNLTSFQCCSFAVFLGSDDAEFISQADQLISGNPNYVNEMSSVLINLKQRAELFVFNENYFERSKLQKNCLCLMKITLREERRIFLCVK